MKRSNWIVLSILSLVTCDQATNTTDGRVAVDGAKQEARLEEGGGPRTEGGVVADGGKQEARLEEGGGAKDGSSTGVPSPGFVDCGASSCSVTTNRCCAITADGGSSATYSCLASGAACSGSAVSCDEPGDCSTGEICCRPTGGIAASCMAASSCTGTSARLRCHLDSDCPTASPKCCSSKLTGGGSCKSSC